MADAFLDHRYDDEFLAENLEPDLLAYLKTRADRSGRTLLGQIEYEYLVNRGLVVPDPHDHEGPARARTFRRMKEGRLLHG
ncbi:hypothetical protein NITMOv2_3795 [Nitrospira moscoviensis]|uniref:Uncharacterized protein n=1 Tax=Nitrospira moscoviensis TaxID=42253 RepID=A0A0K2GGV0_NITMO|nr:hypothetical protein NITMOv2_3795 [Nitrospira moscoviensis]